MTFCISQCLCSIMCGGKMGFGECYGFPLSGGNLNLKSALFCLHEVSSMTTSVWPPPTL